MPKQWRVFMRTDLSCPANSAEAAHKHKKLDSTQGNNSSARRKINHELHRGQKPSKEPQYSLELSLSLTRHVQNLCSCRYRTASVLPFSSQVCQGTTEMARSWKKPYALTLNEMCASQAHTKMVLCARSHAIMQRSWKRSLKTIWSNTFVVLNVWRRTALALFLIVRTRM